MFKTLSFFVARFKDIYYQISRSIIVKKIPKILNKSIITKVSSLKNKNKQICQAILFSMVITLRGLEVAKNKISAVEVFLIISSTSFVLFGKKNYI